MSKAIVLTTDFQPEEVVLHEVKGHIIAFSGYEHPFFIQADCVGDYRVVVTALEDDATRVVDDHILSNGVVGGLIGSPSPDLDGSICVCHDVVLYYAVTGIGVVSLQSDAVSAAVGYSEVAENNVPRSNLHNITLSISIYYCGIHLLPNQPQRLVHRDTFSVGS
jgi:hypothetical protein